MSHVLYINPEILPPDNNAAEAIATLWELTARIQKISHWDLRRVRIVNHEDVTLNGIQALGHIKDALNHTFNERLNEGRMLRA